MPFNQAPQDKQKILGGSLFLKLLVLIGVGLLALTVLQGLKGDIGSILWSIAKFIVGLLIIIFVVWGISSKLIKSSVPSPNEDWRKMLTKACKRRKPFNVQELYISGQDKMTYSRWFRRITGLTFIPYLAAKQSLDENNNPKFVIKKDHKNKIVYDAYKNPVYVPEYETITSEDGEFVIIGTNQPRWKFWNQEEEIVRADTKLVSGIGTKIWLNCVNLNPFNDYWYPNQQWQTQIERIISQNKAEVLLATEKDLIDWHGMIAQMSLRADPNFLRWMESKNESLGQQAQPILLRQ